MDLGTTLDREATEHEPFEAHVGWRAGVGAGLAAATVMGLGMTLVEPALLAESIAGLYGAAGSLAAGWLVHLGHGAAFGLAFAVVLADPSLVRVGHWLPGSVVAGLVYGLVLALVGMGVIMPMWLEGVGLAGAPSLPFVTPALVGWHLVFGAVLGGLFPVLEDG